MSPPTVANVSTRFTAGPPTSREVAERLGEYSMEHNSQIFLLDTQGQLRATFFNAPLATMAKVTRSVATESG